MWPQDTSTASVHPLETPVGRGSGPAHPSPVQTDSRPSSFPSPSPSGAPGEGATCPPALLTHPTQAPARGGLGLPLGRRPACTYQPSSRPRGAPQTHLGRLGPLQTHSHPRGGCALHPRPLSRGQQPNSGQPLPGSTPRPQPALREGANYSPGTSRTHPGTAQPSSHFASRSCSPIAGPGPAHTSRPDQARGPGPLGGNRRAGTTVHRSPTTESWLAGTPSHVAQAGRLPGVS